MELENLDLNPLSAQAPASSAGYLQCTAGTILPGYEITFSLHHNMRSSTYENEFVCIEP